MEQMTPETVLQHFETALKEEQFVVYYQPQYNVTTGMLVGAEALVRWLHPVYGFVSPATFIAVLEDHHLIHLLDLYVYDHVCRFLRYCLDEHIHTVPISINFSREEVYRADFFDELDKVNDTYAVPSSLIHAEIIESVATRGADKANEIIARFHAMGYKVALDDFGSGFSSLNLLKDIPYDILKLDLKFLSGEMSGRAGIIITSIVHMARWLQMPVIAEGVETKQQVDFLKSIGCEYVQGFLYARPMPQKDYLAQLQGASIGLPQPLLKLKDTLHPTSFWDVNSVETLIFNSYASGAAVFRYTADGSLEMLRINQKYITEFGMNMTCQDAISLNPLSTMDEASRKIFLDALRKTIQTEEEQECETWRTIQTGCCGTDKLCIRSTLSLIGKSEQECIFYATVRNVTAEKRQFEEGAVYERSFKNVAEQANIYYWEYTIATHEMRPCYRCMRDLGLPPLVTNYPEPAIEEGIFPPDYADMYRDWLRRIDQGEKSIEGIIPLTVGRIPFHVRYTTEFDELGRPIKAYASATLVTPEEKAES